MYRIPALLVLATSTLVAQTIIQPLPDALRVMEGTPLRIEVAPFGTSPDSIEWYKDSIFLPDQRDDVLGIPTATPADAGEYYAIFRTFRGDFETTRTQVKVVANTLPFFEERTTTPTGGAPTYFEFIDGRFVMSCGGAGLFVSDDGHSWLNAKLPVHAYTGQRGGIVEIVEFEGQWYAFQGSEYPGGWMSDDLYEWTYLPALPGARSAVVGSSRVLIRRTDSTRNNAVILSVSEDMQTWTDLSPAAPDYPDGSITNHIAGQFVVSDRDKVWISTDGFSWTEVAGLPPEFSLSLSARHLPVHDGRLTWVAEEHVLLSENGEDWTALEIAKTQNGESPLRGGNVGESVFALGRFWVHSPIGFQIGFQSTDLVTWERFETGISPREVAGNASRLLLVDHTATIKEITDPEGSESVELPRDRTDQIVRDITPDYLLARDRFGLRYLSSNAVGWERVNLERLAFQNGTYLVYHGNRWQFSFDLENFTQAHEWGGDPEILAAGNGRFVAGSRDETFMWSETGNNDWTETTVSHEPFRRLDFTGARFVAYPTFEDSPIAVIVSTDGDTWERSDIDLGIPSAIRGSIERSDILILVGDHGVFVSENAGVNWDHVPLLGLGTLQSITWHEGRFYLSAANGTLLSSADGRAWDSALMGVGGAVTSFQDTLIVGGDGGPWLYSGQPAERRVVVSGIDEYVPPRAGDLVRLDITVEGMQTGDRLQIWRDAALVEETGEASHVFYWRVGPAGPQALRIVVLHAGGGETSRVLSFDVGAPQTQLLGLSPTPPGTRRSFHRRVGDLFFHTSGPNLIRYSTDLHNWTDAVLPDVPAEFDLNDGPDHLVSRAGSGYMMQFYHLFWYSEDLVTWVSRDAPAGPNASYHLFAIPDWFIVLHQTGPFTTVVYRSKDGAAWEGPLALPFEDGSLQTTLGNAFLSTAVDGQNRDGVAVWTTTDGENWSRTYTRSRTFPRSFGVFNHEAILLMRDRDTNAWHYARSSDGTQWTEGQIPIDHTLLELIAFGGGTYLARNEDWTHLTSTDLQNWEPLPFDNSLFELVGELFWHDGRWVNNGYEGGYPTDHLTSPDLISWEIEELIAPFRRVTAIEEIDGSLAFLARSTLHLLHADGRWTNLVPGVAADQVVKWKGRWVVGSEELKVSVVGAETPKITDLRSLGDGFRLADLLVHGDSLVALADSGSYWTTDGESWEYRPISFPFEAEFGTFFENTFAVWGRPDRFSPFSFASSGDEGRSWTAVERPGGEANRGSDLTGFHARGDGRLYFSFGSDGNYRSEDGRAWENVPAGIDGGLYLAAGLDRAQARYVEGVREQGSWLVQPDPPAPSFSVAQFEYSGPSIYFNGRIIGTRAEGIGDFSPVELHVTPLADLAPVLPESLPAATPGELFTVPLSIENFGFDSAFLDQPLQVDVHLTANRTFGDADDIPLGRLYHGGVHRHHAGAVHSFSFSAPIPAELPSGILYLGVRLHDADFPLDYSLSNNIVISGEPVVAAAQGQRGLAHQPGLDVSSADPDRASLPTVIEELLGTSLHGAGPAPWTIGGSLGALTLRFRHRKTPGDGLVLELSPDLRRWSPVPPPQWIGIAEDDEFIIWEVVLPPEPRQFFRFVAP